MAEKVEAWLCDGLNRLGIDASIDIARYILSIETSEDLEEYMSGLLDSDEKRTQPFIRELVTRWRPYKSSQANDGIQVYRKTDLDEVYVPGKEKKSPANQRDRKPRKNFVLNGHDVENRGVMPGEEKPPPQLPPPERTRPAEKDVKKKQKFVPLYSKEGQAMSVILIPGRHACECQAGKHRLINNCSRCGRVVCEQEGSGPCHFCGHLVCSKEEEEILSRGSKNSEKLRQQLINKAPTELLGKHLFLNGREYLHSNKQKIQDSLKEAEKHKNKLLEFDKTSARRTQVIDDEADYFSTDSNQWLSTQDREKLRKREEELRSLRHAPRKDRKITLDFAGRQVIEEDPSAGVNMYDVNDDVVQTVNFGARPKQKSGKYAEESNDYLVNPGISVQAPKFVPQAVHTKAPSSTQQGVGAVRSLPRIQDRELLEMSDEGMCMSMHQPWASLLIAGIKIHEGRSWYTPHRGRLWIAATAKMPEPAVIAEMEEIYRRHNNNRPLDFPSHYPVGCLLGCVEVVDCLPQEDYQQQFPDGDSGDPYVFICDNPKELLVKFPIKGKHKIYKLESHIHKAAKKGLR
ncbi:activating signal cointegrator 1-like [Dreissena polymorpha]|uniref:ASCH domain-containing protein n=1 Tax=Dreissena polymorpha TaxID=45954 RepID=A0A9D4KKX8_DREPO|nr:activating signal cointegrator 1-like [Dreissena polymorpha]KAH3840986.1 hypothetical protein DPMN_114444 [Dreissena polymorpha]